jgi:uncharacterized protein (DUF1778 family)
MPAAALRGEQVAERQERRPVSFRIPEPVLDLVDRAAERTHQDRTTFVVAAALEKAREVLRDQTVFNLTDDQYARFVAALDDPQPANERLKALVRRKALWTER